MYPQLINQFYYGVILLHSLENTQVHSTHFDFFSSNQQWASFLKLC